MYFFQKDNYFQKTCTPNITDAKIRQINVFSVIGSLKRNILNVTNTIIPTPNPINRDGQSSPSNALTK